MTTTDDGLGIPDDLRVANRKPLTDAQEQRLAELNRPKIPVGSSHKGDRLPIPTRKGPAPAAPKAPRAKKPAAKAKTAAKKAPARAQAAKGAAKAGNGGVRPGSKLELVVGLLKRPEGCTTAEVLASTGWPAVSMPQMAKSAGLTLQKEKEKGSVTRYRAA